MTGPLFRLASPEDKPRILAIASQIWEGDDYLPDVIDDWLAPGSGQLVVAVLDDEVVGLARYDRAVPGYAWFEGLRIDPAYRNRGLAKALTGHLVERATEDGADRIGLSTYFDNIASQRVSAAFGFQPVASFAYMTADVPDLQDRALVASQIVAVSPDESAAFIAASRALRLGGGFLPHSWRFYPFARAPRIALGHMSHLFGMRRGRELVALLCVGDDTPHGSSSLSIDFLDGDPSSLAVLARHAFAHAGKARYIEAMVPCFDAEIGPGAEVLNALGFKTLNDGKADVFVYERDLPE